MRRLLVAFDIPGDCACGYQFEPHGGRFIVEVVHGERPGDGETGGQPVSKVGAVDVQFGAPGDQGRHRGTQLFGDVAGER